MEGTVIILAGNAFLSLKKFRLINVTISDIFCLRKSIFDRMDLFFRDIYFNNASCGELCRFFPAQTVLFAVWSGFFIKGQGDIPDFVRRNLLFIRDGLAAEQNFVWINFHNQNAVRLYVFGGVANQDSVPVIETTGIDGCEFSLPDIAFIEKCSVAVS